MFKIYVDADGCPVKDEVFKVAQRYGVQVTLVANKWMQLREADWIELVVVGQGFDEADDWIVEHADENDIVISTDIPLASRSLKKGARVLSPTGKVFTVESIGDTVATRDMMASLREQGMMTGGPAPFGPKDRSRFLQRLVTLGGPQGL